MFCWQHLLTLHVMRISALIFLTFNLYCRRRLVKRIYVPMPDATGRLRLLKNTLQDQSCKLTKADVQELVSATEGYSGSDLAALCREAAMQPIR